MSYVYISSNGVKYSTSLGFKAKAEQLIKVFESYEIGVIEKIIK